MREASQAEAASLALEVMSRRLKRMQPYNHNALATPNSK
jgi:hypothetical protein